MTSHFEMAEILAAALDFHKVGGDREDFLMTFAPDENGAFSEFEIQRDGETFSVTVRKL